MPRYDDFVSGSHAIARRDLDIPIEVHEVMHDVQNGRHYEYHDVIEPVETLEGVTRREVNYRKGSQDQCDVRLSSPFGPRKDPHDGRPDFHGGVDVIGPEGKPVHSTCEGRVVVSRFQGRNKEGKEKGSGPGEWIMVRCDEPNHRNEVREYMHLRGRSVKEGDRVRRGQQIGTLGDTGSSTGPHLHYGEAEFKDPGDPAKYRKENLKRRDPERYRETLCPVTEQALLLNDDFPIGTNESNTPPKAAEMVRSYSRVPQAPAAPVLTNYEYWAGLPYTYDFSDLNRRWDSIRASYGHMESPLYRWWRDYVVSSFNVAMQQTLAAAQLALSWFNTGMNYWQLGMPLASWTAFFWSNCFANAVGNAVVAGRTFLMNGQNLHVLGDHQNAHKFYNQACIIGQQTGDAVTVSASHYNTALLARSAGNAQWAMGQLQLAWSSASTVNYLPIQASVASHFGDFALIGRNVPAAVAHYRNARQGFAAVGYTWETRRHDDLIRRLI